MQSTLQQPAAVEAPRAPRVSALGKISAAALAGIALAIGYILVAMFGFAAMPAAIAGVCLLVAGLTLAGLRWAPALGLLPALPVLGMFVPMMLGDSGSPLFPVGLIMAACGVLAVVLGVAATVQNYARPAAERRLPRWAPAAVALVLGAAIGAQLLGLLPRPDVAAGVSPEVLATLPAVTTVGFEFDQPEIRVRAGETVALRLENADPEPHSFDIDELGVHAPMPVGETGLALFQPTEPGTYTFYCAPHYDKASGEGMKGTLIVE
ncbi:MAG TPA: cupredoxin domain-containing protein [Chloroflexaceae bacterium]|nr:cupredoxin domain-containing protein [Chloroflexaceae bacterium]